MFAASAEQQIEIARRYVGNATNPMPLRLIGEAMALSWQHPGQTFLILEVTCAKLQRGPPQALGPATGEGSYRPPPDPISGRRLIPAIEQLQPAQQGMPLSAQS